MRLPNPLRLQLFKPLHLLKLHLKSKLQQLPWLSRQQRLSQP